MTKMPPARRPWVVAALADPARLVDEARRARRDGADLLEVRADAFPVSLLASPGLPGSLKSLRRSAGLPLLLTLRHRREGGRLPRGFSERARLAVIEALLPAVDAVDVEGTSSIARAAVRAAHRAGRWVVLSHHDFKKTPSGRSLAGWTANFKRLGGDVLKVAATPRTRGDVDRLMAFCAGLDGRRAFISMGVLGRRTRLEAKRWGSCLTYGYVGRPTAPGQPSVKALRALSG